MLVGKYYIAGVKLELGSVATPFVPRPYGEELALCQRYYQRQMMQCNPIAVAGVKSNNLALETSFNVPMRVTPTVNFSNRLFCHNTCSDVIFTISSINKTFEYIQNIVASDSNLIGGYFYSGLFIFDAEIY